MPKPHTPPHKALRFHQGGFSLMEMAVVLMILGTLMSGILVAVSQTTENNRRSTALAQLRQIEEALYGYVQVHEYLPCPASHTSAGVAVPTNGTACTYSHGFVPAASLDFSGPTNDDGLLVDPWQNPYRYSVATNHDFNQSANLTAVFSSGTFNAGMLKVCDAANCTGGVIAETLPVVVYSMGANWATVATATSEEQENANPGSLLGTYPVGDDLEFVSTTYSQDNFDDLITWISPYILFNRMISAGKLP